MALTAKHAQLLKSNRALLLTFEGFSVTTKLSAVGVALALACGGGIQALKGTASDTVQVCIRNKQTLQCADKSGKSYLMTEYHAQQWKADGIPGEVVFRKSIPATNPHKALWMLLSACSFGAAGVGLRSLQNSERQLAGYEAIAQKRDLAKGEITARGELLEDYRGVAISEVHLQADLEAAANDRAVVLKQCEVLGEADIKIAQLDAEEAIFEAETAGLSDDKKQEYMEFLRNQKTPFLLSLTQTLAGINNPGDKVDQSVAAPAIEPNPNLEISRQIAAKVLNSLAGINTSIFLAAPTRCGKTHTLHKWLGDLITRFPRSDIYVISQKYEDFPGVRSNRLMVFDPMQVEQSMQFLDEVYEKLLTRKSKPATEETYRDRPIKLILEDWFATHQCLSQKRNAAIWESVATKLGTIATVGGQYNVGYFICTQSFNIASSGVADCNIRLNLALLAQGLVRTTSNDEEQGSYGVIEQMLNNSNVIASKETRDRLTSDLRLLIEPSMTEQTPIILSTIGNPVLGLMPKIDVHKSAVADVPTWNTPNTSENSGTPKTPLEPEPEQPGSLIEQREHLSEMLEQLLTGTAEKAVFAADSPLEQEDKMKLAKLVIAQELGQEKTIWLLWGVRRGGRNHALYTEARAMLDRLINGEE
ncbi:hypothetical protein Osc7112_6347 (plasmid) [Oscillatoria nigro-viridis PCC 7112]|uniref:Uncharacterized protein n=1 Tax=Phormidium nigroviride PCC 7112 TaxID=179408 RepID=K9VSM2_9CYAN|nr:MULTISPECIES: hypothetical protein [Oscillatoriales]AFZ10507.1 hypothetical protein Osc7112_6347 [Oscillatoria nigro-viridis PCC 7112]MBE9123233.1 hypothetical protein [Tychonema sp. LEGE 07199]MBE9133685.1 hypothetical protein [Tychonema sp. LEGE 07196]